MSAKTTKTHAGPVFFLLLLLTFLNAGMGFIDYSGKVVIFILVISVWVKGHLIIDYFMHLKNAPKLWRRLIHAWLFVVCSVILGVFV
ncbi:MAG: cytochrome C oxidase subunit IV family protein [bacterium]